MLDLFFWFLVSLNFLGFQLNIRIEKSKATIDERQEDIK